MPSRSIPRTRSFDATRAFLSEGYTFVSSRCERLQSDVFRTRLMLRPAVCALGEEAAGVFYTPGRFTRKGALPPTTLMLLQDRGSVQLKNGTAHRHRKQMFLSLMGEESLAHLREVTAEEWQQRASRWGKLNQVVLFPEVEAILCRAACRWTGVPLAEHEAEERTQEFHAMIDGAGAVGVRNWKGLLLRRRTERWMQDLIEKVRSGALNPPAETALAIVSHHVDGEGERLDVAVAAVEMLNLLRPTVAIARYVVFAAMAMHEHPEARARLAAEHPAFTEAFVHEVRRYYPFFPVVGGRVREPFEWRTHRFEEGDWMLLDLYGTTHDRRIWEDPEVFRPERFLGQTPNPFTLIPQGGGDHATGHRCAGEWATIEVMKTTTRLLATGMRFEVPDQDLTVDLNRMPALPRSRFLMRSVYLT